MAFYTLGCKVNRYESDALAALFEAAGYSVVSPREMADVYIINSCTVTGSGDKKSLQVLRRLSSKNPGAVIVLSGCLPQAFPDRAAEVLQADIITGTKNRAALVDMVSRRLEGKPPYRVVSIESHNPDDVFEEIWGVTATERTRAFLKIQDGCGCGCTYCIIPRARGKVRSRPMDNLVFQLKRISELGIREVVLSGVNLGCYGMDLGLSLSHAIEAACNTDGIERVRLGSVEPNVITPAEAYGWADFADKLCGQFHLSLQSGADITLGRMGRRYTTEDYCELVKVLRKVFPECSITTDIMVGFPGEDEDAHNQSLEFVEKIGFARTHIFSYSARPGTIAADMPGQVESKTKARRMAEMDKICTKSREEFLTSRLGKDLKVLVESCKDGICFGHTSCFSPVYFLGYEESLGKVLGVRLTRLYKDGCWGEKV